MKKIGIIGCGAIGTGIAEYIEAHMKDRASVAALCDIDKEKSDTLSRKITPNPVVADIERVMKESDLIIESAGVKISGEVAEKALLNKKDVLIMSTGGLLEKKDLLKKANSIGCNIYIPSGAICGIDGVRAASIGKIKKVSLTTRKPLKGLKGSVKDIDKIKEETVVYNGNAKDAVKQFPKNINVAATLSLSGIGPEETKVMIITAPHYTKNIHEVEVEGEFGKLFTRTENVPAKENPKTSQLAIFSALAKLEEIV